MLFSSIQAHIPASFIHSSSCTRFFYALKFTHPLYSCFKVHAPALLAHSSSHIFFIRTLKFMHPHFWRIQVHALASFTPSSSCTLTAAHSSSRTRFILHWHLQVHAPLHSRTQFMLSHRPGEAHQSHAPHTQACPSLTRA